MPLQPRDRLGPYEIQALLGAGGMGEVYRGRDTRLGRDVALKVISPARLADAELRRRFELEARAASVLNHPSIVTIYDVGESEGISWIAMEWVEGRTLREVLVEGFLPVSRALSITRQIAEGLAVAHAKGIVHRDLKPENVMLTTDGRTKILDFGLARQTIVDALESGGTGSVIDTVAGLPSEPTVEGAILGTVGYMSPEQASGRPVDFRSDQFSFALIAYEMLAGRRAFARPTAVQTLAAIIGEEPAPLASIRSDIPTGLDAVIARCLAKRPEDRFASTRELVVALEFLGTGTSAVSVARPATAVVTPPQPAVERRRPLRRPAVVIGVVLGLALAAAAYVRFGGAKRPIESLAVLPFTSGGGDADAEYLGDGLAENLIDQLSRLPALRVMARATAFRFKDASDPQEAGRKLGAGAVLTGRVSRRGNDLTISAELIDTSTGARLWGENFDRPISDLLRVQDAIASAVSNGLRLRLSDDEKRALSLHGTENAEAYELALKARHFFQKETEEANLDARRLFEDAAEKDPKFVEAHLGIAATYASMGVNGWAAPSEGGSRYTEELAQALTLEPRNVVARAALVHRRFYLNWDWSYCEGEYRELATDPRLLRTEVFRPIALYYWARGRTDDALALMDRALRIDPGSVSSKMMRANFLTHAGKLDDAIAEYRSIAQDDVSNPGPLYGLAEALRRRGEIAGAIETLRKAYALSGEENGVKALAAAKTVADYEKAEAAVARSRLDELEDLATERYVSPLDLARLQSQAGEREKAFASLDAALAERSPGLVFAKVDRAWTPIRDDPRFAGIVRRVGIP